MIRKYFRVTSQQDLPDTQDADYHPLQNVKSGMEHLRDKSQELRNLGSARALDKQV